MRFDFALVEGNIEVYLAVHGGRTVVVHPILLRDITVQVGHQSFNVDFELEDRSRCLDS